MPQKYFDADDNEVETLTPEETKQIQEERDALTKERESLVKEKEELLAEKKRLEDGGLDKEENMKKIKNLAEWREKKLEELEKKINDKDEYEKKTVKESLFKHYAGDDEESRKKLEAEYGFINLDESNPENIATRMEKAARVSGLYKENEKHNPAFGSWSGSAPILKPTKGDKDDPDNILNTDRGRAALGAMGVPTEDPKKK